MKSVTIDTENRVLHFSLIWHHTYIRLVQCCCCCCKSPSNSHLASHLTFPASISFLLKSLCCSGDKSFVALFYPPPPHSITFHLSVAFHRRTLLRDVFLPRLYACDTSLFTLLSCCLKLKPCIKPGASEKVLFAMSSVFLLSERISRDQGILGYLDFL